LKIRSTGEFCEECKGPLLIDENSYTSLYEQPLFTIKELFCKKCGLVHNKDLCLDIEVEKMLYSHLIRDSRRYDEKKKFISSFCKRCGSQNLKFGNTYVRNDGIGYGTRCLICGHYGTLNVSQNSFSFNGLKEKIIDFCKPHHGKTFPEIKKLVEKKFKITIAMSSLKNFGVIGSCSVPSRNIKENPKCVWCGDITEKGFWKGKKRWKCKSSKCGRCFTMETKTRCDICNNPLGKPIKIGICNTCQDKLKEKFIVKSKKHYFSVRNTNKRINKYLERYSIRLGRQTIENWKREV
jgi:hypothetical protein